MFVLRFFILLSILTSFSQADQDNAATDFDLNAAPFLENYCLRCHNEKKQKGDFRLDHLSRDFSNGHDSDLWLEVLERINSGEMPPEDEKLPEEKEILQLTTWLGEQLREGVKIRMAKRAPVAHYRLSREEYTHSIRDLLGLEYDTRAPGAFTPDPAWHGFTRLGSQLTIAPSHIEKYFIAAEKILEEAFPSQPIKNKFITKDAISSQHGTRGKRGQLEQMGIAEQVRSVVWAGHTIHVGPGGISTPGYYKIKLQVSGLKPKDGRTPHLTLYSKKEDRTIFESDVHTTETEPQVFEFTTYFSKGQHSIILNNDIPGRPNAGRSGRETGQFVFTTIDNPLSRAPWQRKLTNEEGEPILPFLLYDWITYEGPVQDPSVLSKRQKFMPEKTNDQSTIKAALHQFALHAWRRPAKDSEINRYLNIVLGELSEGEKFDSAMKSGLLGILISKNFITIAEGDAIKKRPYLNDWEIATRLSSTLWSSLPDEDLIKAARNGGLNDPEKRRQHFQRMLANQKIDRFTSSFPQQWLQLSKVGEFPPDKKLYPDYDKWLEQSMVLETIEFFKRVFNKNMSMKEFIDSDWTVLNPRLALHYNHGPLKNVGFQKVKLNSSQQRGGILTHASVLSLSSDGSRHRPVHRGAWLSESILGKTPNPPPANVEPIEPNPVDQPKATIRTKLEAHTSNPNCASCHKNIDPYGFAFDHFDAIGRYRTEEKVEKGQGKNPFVNASGELPDGRRYHDHNSFKQLLIEDIDQIAHAFVEKLATYSLRRAMTLNDQEDIEQVVNASKKNDYELKSLIENFITSDLFIKR